MNNNNNIFQIEIDSKILEVNTRNLTENANGSAFIQYGGTSILATCVMAENKREEIDFFPLTVDYEEKYYAAGKILGSRFLRREARPSDEAILISRLIDRAIRPLFPKSFKNDVQVIVTCLSWDGENDPATLGLLAASFSLLISDIPWNGPIAAVRIGKTEKPVVFPNYKVREEGLYDLVVTGIQEQEDLLINMLEGEAKEVEEQEILEAVDFAKIYLKKLISFQKEIAQKIGKEKIVVQKPKKDLELEKEIKSFLGDGVEKLLSSSENKETSNSSQNDYQFTDLKNNLGEFLKQYDNPRKIIYGLDFLEKEFEKTLHHNIIEKEERPDGRKIDQIREISSDVGLLPRIHGSGLFCRGKTKSLSILTLGAPGDQRLLEGMEIRGKKHFMHHYNFPPYCSGEVKPLRGPGRREIGHGMLAEKALSPIIPDFEEFSYTIRIVSEILCSNGSTSMAAVCSSCLALMDAGVPIKRPAAGIAMGLIIDQQPTTDNQRLNYKVLTDIQGPEDHYGDMDFKIAGTKLGISALQMDVKIKGITEKILTETMLQAKKAREEILKKMEKTISKPRAQLSPFAPRVYTLLIKPEKIREVIGPGGKIINEIIGECGVSIDIEENGKIFITAEKDEAAKKALAWINNITREIREGEIFQGKVKRILDFGAFVELFPGQEGLVHISQLAPFRVRKVEDVVKVGDIIPVKVISIDQQGRINLSLKEANPVEKFHTTNN